MVPRRDSTAEKLPEGLPSDELAEVALALEGPFVPLDLDDLDHWAKTGEGDPWRPAA